MCWHTSMRTLARNARVTGSQLLNVWPIIGQNPCRNCFSSRSALEAETRFSSIWLPSGRKPMAPISAVTALRSHATFLSDVVGATYTSEAFRSLAGGCVTRSLRQWALSVAI